MLVDEQGKFVSARTSPRLLGVSIQWEAGGFRVAAGAAGSFWLPKRPKASALRCVQIWRDEVQALVIAEGSAWFSQYLGRPVDLVYQPPQALRPIKRGGTGPFDLVSFADAYPLLLCSDSSLRDLNRHSTEPIGMRRFRPNVVINGAKAYDEDCWESVQLGSGAFYVPKLCDRCVMTTVDETTGQRGKEPLKALARLRRWNGKVWFGANLVPTDGGHLRVGDVLTVQRRREHPAGPGWASRERR